MKVLIADDELALRRALRRSLNEWGYEVTEAADGQEAWRALGADDPPRIAILDWVMPGMDGVAICKRLGEREGLPFVYTILLTAKTDKEDLVYALESGAHNFQSKPISLAELRSHVNVGRRLVEADDKLKEYAAEMERLATTDALTGIHNRRHFLGCAELEVCRALRYRRPLSALAMDLDFFKRVNDTYGHAVGDETLKVVTDTCLGALRENDLFGRLGGDEFAVLLPETGVAVASQVAERLRAGVAEAALPQKDDVPFTVSVGVTTLDGDRDTLEEVLRRADQALYEAKRAGRNRVKVG